MHRFYEPDIMNGAAFLNEEESHHAIKALRLREGDLINVLDGKGTICRCRIIKTTKRCEFEILSHETVSKRPFSVHIAIAPTKNQDRIEWFIEKATEIGIEQVSFVITKNTEKIRLRKERLIKKAVSAMKQSLNLWLPEINDELRFADFIRKYGEDENKFMAWLDENQQLHLIDAVPAGQSALALIGPEGDFAHEEVSMAVESGYKIVSLGPNRLRTETAGIVACHILNLKNRE